MFTIAELAAMNSIQGHGTGEQRKDSITFGDTPLDELADLIDILIWDSNPPDPFPVSEWLDELQARSDADQPEVQRAIDVCKDYLAS